MKQNFNLEKILLVAGLGNPGKEYVETFHNVGADLVNFLAEKEDFKSVSRKKFLYVKKHDLILMIPEEPMNNSGPAIKEAVDYFKIKPEFIAVAHDDSDIEIGNFKISFDRGSAGHKGARSTINALGTKKFWRIRIGIRKAGNKEKAGDFVLSRIAGEDKIFFEQVFTEIKNLFGNHSA